MPDISNMNYQELHVLKAAVTERMKDMRDTGITQLRATIAEQANILGIDVTDLMPKKQKRKRRSKDEIEAAQHE
jgi:ribosomal protein S18